jgi:hypothetical protein
MKTITRIFATLCVLGAAAACQQFEIDTQMTPEKEYANLRLVCDALTTYSVSATRPDNITFNVSSNSPWTVTRSGGADWCTVTPASSSASSLVSDVVVSCADNDTGEDRSATLTIAAERISKYYTVTITQSRKGHLYVTPVAKDYAATGGPLTFTINTNVPWTVRSDVSWLKFDPEMGQPDPDGRTITIVATAQPSDVLERMATVTVTAGDEEETFDVTQKGTFEMTEITGEFPGNGGSQALKIRTDLPWTVSADKDWITFDQEEGAGDGKLTVVTVTAKPNEDVARKAVITVRVAGEDHSFEVHQGGASFNIVPPADPTIDRKGGELLIEVNSSKAWEPQTDVPGFGVEKVDDSHFKVVAGFNNLFAPRKGAVTIVSSTGATDSVEISQDVNFTFDGHFDILEDGSVKVYGDQKTRITTADKIRYASFVLNMGETHFEDGGQLFLCTHDAGNGTAEYQCQVALNGNKRLRTNGSGTTYGSVKFDITKDEMNALKTYRVDFAPDPEAAGNIRLEFLYNGTSKCVLSNPSVYTDDPETGGHYFIGYDSAGSDGTWYVIKSCDITFIEG